MLKAVDTWRSTVRNGEAVLVGDQTTASPTTGFIAVKGISCH